MRQIRYAFYLLTVAALLLWTAYIIGLITWEIIEIPKLLADNSDVKRLGSNSKKFSEGFMTLFIFMQILVWAVIAVPVGIIALVLKPDPRHHIRIEPY